MVAANILDLLNTKGSDIKELSPLPAGTYIATPGQYEMTESSQKKTTGVKYSFVISEADADVDQDTLKASGGLRNERGELNRKVSETFWLTPDSTFRIKNYVKDVLGLDADTMTLGDMIAAIPGNAVKISLRLKTSEKTNRVFNEISGFAKV